MAFSYELSTIQILEQGLSSMTKTCELLTAQNDTLNKEVAVLTDKVARLKDKLIINKV